MQSIALRYFIFTHHYLMGTSIVAYKKMAISFPYFKVGKFVDFYIHFIKPSR